MLFIGGRGFVLVFVLLCITCVLSSFVIILKRKRELDFIVLHMFFTVNVLRLFLMVLWVGPRCVIVVFSDHTHLPFEHQILVFTVSKVMLDCMQTT